MSDRKTTVLLIRHAVTDTVGKRLTSRMPGIPLSTEGIAQVAHLRARLRGVPLAAIYSSPLERAIATAEPLASERVLDLQILDVLTEVDFGDWTGCTFEQLDGLSEWRRFNRERGRAPVPNGESACDVQNRIVGALHELGSKHRGETIAVVSHADVIRNAVLHAASVPLDAWYTFEISPASITSLALDGASARLLTVNERPYLAPGL